MSREELRRLLRAIEEDPEAREEIRRAVLSEDLLALPHRVTELDARLTARLDQLAGTVAELDARLTARLDQLAGTVAELDARLTARLDQLAGTVAELDARLTARLDQLAGTVAELDARLTARLDQLAGTVAELDARLTARLDQLTVSVDRLSEISRQHADRLGYLDGQAYEWRFERVAPGRLMRLPLRRLRPVVGDRRYGLTDDAVEAGRVSLEEAADLQEADFMVTGRLEEGGEAYAVVEVSIGIGQGDAERAVRRAEVLSRASGRPVLPVVAGERLAVPDLREDVWVVLDGRVWKPGEHPMRGSN